MPARSMSPIASRVASSCAASGHEAHRVVDVGLRDTDDAAVWGHAVREGTGILTKDEDFASHRLHEPHGPTIVWLGVGNRRTVSET
jgi:predicted nuclease of predicted toxin-antitoxin system